MYEMQKSGKTISKLVLDASGDSSKRVKYERNDVYFDFILSESLTS